MSGNSDPQQSDEIDPNAKPTPSNIKSDLDSEKKKILTETINDILKGIPFIGPYIVIVKVKWGWTGILLLIGGFLTAVVFAYVGLFPDWLISYKYKNVPTGNKSYELKPQDQVPWESVLKQAKHKLQASGIALTHINTETLTSKVAHEEVQATLVMVDPCGDAVKRRQEDEGNDSASQNIFHQLKGFGRYTSDSKLSPKEKLKLEKSLEIWLIEGYPTMAIIIVDDDLYAYFCTYGSSCATSPVLIFKNYHGNPDAEYFARQFSTIFNTGISTRVKRISNYDQYKCAD
jgi:hypothetical protein